MLRSSYFLFNYFLKFSIFFRYLSYLLLYIFCNFFQHLIIFLLKIHLIFFNFISYVVKQIIKVINFFEDICQFRIVFIKLLQFVLEFNIGIFEFGKNWKLNIIYLGVYFSDIRHSIAILLIQFIKFQNRLMPEYKILLVFEYDLVILLFLFLD